MACNFHLRAVALFLLLAFFATPLRADVDLDLTFSLPPEPPTAGMDFVLEILLENKGDTPATQVTLTNHFPSPVQVKAYTGNYSEALVQDNFLYLAVGALSAGGKAAYKFTLNGPEGILVLTCTTRGNETESILWNNLLTFQVEVGPAVTLPPSVTITSPLPTESIPFGAQVNFSAAASDPDGQVARVVFLVNGSAIGELSNPPFQFPWRPQNYGEYTLTATAYDDLGAAASSTVTLQVQPPPRNKIVSFKIDAGSFEIFAGSEPGRTAMLLSSEDLVTWEPVDSTVALENIVSFKGDFSSQSQRFYRVVD